MFIGLNRFHAPLHWKVKVFVSTHNSYKSLTWLFLPQHLFLVIRGYQTEETERTELTGWSKKTQTLERYITCKTVPLLSLSSDEAQEHSCQRPQLWKRQSINLLSFRQRGGVIKLFPQTQSTHYLLLPFVQSPFHEEFGKRQHWCLIWKQSIYHTLVKNQLI